MVESTARPESVAFCPHGFRAGVDCPHGACPEIRRCALAEAIEAVRCKRAPLGECSCDFCTAAEIIRDELLSQKRERTL
jgi:hypothetical protein